MATSRSNRQRRVPRPPILVDNHGRGWQLNLSKDLHQLAINRIKSGRDLKVIITAKNSQTGVGKTTCAGWLAMSWTKMFARQDWYCNPDDPGEGMATLDPELYFDIIKKVGKEYPAGTAVIVDDAEELDSRRSMQDLNVEFSQRWMLMRLKQAITILTLPSPSSIDSRLEELADIWINITRRGRGLVHNIAVEDYGSRGILTEQTEWIEFPDISQHAEMLKLQQMKEQKMNNWDEDEEEEIEYPIEDQVDFALQIKEDTDCSWRDIPDQDHRLADKLDYSGEWYRKKRKDLDKDE